MNITATNLMSITITWDEVQCIDRNSDITEYMIKFNGRIATSNTSQFIASRLFPSTTYTFQIAAKSINGTGPFNNITDSTSQPQGSIKHVNCYNYLLGIVDNVKILYIFRSQLIAKWRA